MLPGMELMSCPEMAVPREVMHHVVQVESSYNPYAIGVVGGHLVRQPRTLPEALSTVRMLEARGFNFSVGIAQVNRYNLVKYGLTSYAHAFEVCPNLLAGSRILAECYQRHRDWGKSFSCYYSGNPVTGFRHGYVQKVFASMAKARGRVSAEASGIGIPVVAKPSRRPVPVEYFPLQRDSRIDASAARTSPLDPTVRSAATPDPAFVGGAPLHKTVPVTEAQPSAVPALAALAPLTAPASTPSPAMPLSAGPVRLQPTPTSAVAPSRPIVPPADGDGAFVF